MNILLLIKSCASALAKWNFTNFFFLFYCYYYFYSLITRLFSSISKSYLFIVNKLYTKKNTLLTIEKLRLQKSFMNQK
jgi:hypothetical protein